MAYMQFAVAAGAVLGRLSRNQGRRSAAEVPDEDVQAVSCKQVKHPTDSRQTTGIKAVRLQVIFIE